jgi:hypothetical protein
MIASTPRLLVLFALTLLGTGCDDIPDAIIDLAMGRDLGSEHFNGKWAVELDLMLDSAGDGGAPAEPYRVLAILDGDELASTRDATPVAAVWSPCQLDLPGGLHLPADAAGLAPLFAPSTASASSTRPGATLTEPPVPLLGGTQVASLLTDPLPAAGAPTCAPNGPVPCLRPNAATGRTGVRALASGLDPDADEVDVDFRFTFALHAAASIFDGASLSGKLTSAALEWNVVGCRLRSGDPCAASDVAALEAARPSVTLSGQTVRAHLQLSGFSCGPFLADPEAALTTLLDAAD